MALFSQKSNSYIGIDIGSASIKLLEVEDKSGGAVLKNYGFAEKAVNYETTRTAEMIQKSADLIKRIYKEAGFTAKNVVAALHNFDVFSSVINLPEVKTRELENIIRVEARKFVPIPLEDVVLDWKIIEKHRKTDTKNSKKETGKKNDRDTFLIDSRDIGIDVLLTAAPRNLVKKYVEIFHNAELNLLSLETESFSFIRALLDKNDASSVMFLDIGSVASDILIVEGQVPVVIRSIDVGGNAITAAIGKTMNISDERAEQFKRDVGIMSASSRATDDAPIAQVIETAFGPVINEITYSLDLYRSRGQSVERIVLSGGSANLSGLSEFLKSNFRLPVYIGDPWHKISYNPQLKSNLEQIGPMFTVAIGLALKEIVG